MARVAGTALGAFAITVAAAPEDKKKESSGIEFLQYASDLELRGSFRRALRILKTYVTGRDYRYRAPWYLLAGESRWNWEHRITPGDQLRFSITFRTFSEKGRKIAEGQRIS